MNEVARGVRAALAFALGFAVTFSIALSPLRALAGPEAELANAVNRMRAAHKLIPLAPQRELAAVARAHALEMAKLSYLDHVNRAGQNPLERVQAAGVSGFRMLAENIGASTVSRNRSEAIVSGWMDSRDHRENLLNPAFNAAGLAVIEAPDGRTVAVQLYATFPRAGE